MAHDFLSYFAFLVSFGHFWDLLKYFFSGVLEGKSKLITTVNDVSLRLSEKKKDFAPTWSSESFCTSILWFCSSGVFFFFFLMGFLGNLLLFCQRAPQANPFVKNVLCPCVVLFFQAQ